LPRRRPNGYHFALVMRSRARMLDRGPSKTSAVRVYLLGMSYREIA
jgi:hypothetical protein